MLSPSAPTTPPSAEVLDTNEILVDEIVSYLSPEISVGSIPHRMQSEVLKDIGSLVSDAVRTRDQRNVSEMYTFLELGIDVINTFSSNEDRKVLKKGAILKILKKVYGEEAIRQYESEKFLSAINNLDERALKQKLVRVDKYLEDVRFTRIPIINELLRDHNTRLIIQSVADAIIRSREENSLLTSMDLLNTITTALHNSKSSYGAEIMWHVFEILEMILGPIHSETARQDYITAVQSNPVGAMTKTPEGF
jgi:hypothetical protein